MEILLRGNGYFRNAIFNDTPPNVLFLLASIGLLWVFLMRFLAGCIVWLLLLGLAGGLGLGAMQLLQFSGIAVYEVGAITHISKSECYIYSLVDSKKKLMVFKRC